MTDPPTLVIPADIHDAMIEHCRRTLPRECCGILGGIPPRVSSFYPLRNIASDGETRYDADPADILDAVRQLRLRGGEFLAIYHSHPRWEAVPSRVDLQDNHYGELPRIIVSMLSEPPDVRVWRLEPDAFHEIAWALAPPDPPPPPRSAVGTP